jgi:uncharacterized protein YndB with AHSA1/START domain
MPADILHAVEIEASPEDVYGAVSSQKGLASFWTSDCDAEATEGAVARFGFPQAPVDQKMRIDALEPGRRVAWTAQGDFPHWESTTLAWEMEPSDNGTNLLFRHGGWGDGYPEQDWASVNWVWGQVVARLKGYAESGEPQPFFG